MNLLNIQQPFSRHAVLLYPSADISDYEVTETEHRRTAGIGPKRGSACQSLND